MASYLVTSDASCFGCPLPWVRVARGENWFGYFKWRVITLPRVQVALGAYCLGCVLVGVQVGLVTLNGVLSRCLGCQCPWVL